MLEQLYQGLYNDGHFTGSFEDFQSKMQDSEYRQKLHAGIVEDGDFTGDLAAFEEKYVGKTEGSQTTDVTAEPQTVSTGTESTSEDGSSESQKTDWNSPELRGEWKLNTDPQGQNIWSRKYDVKDADGGTDVINEIVPTDEVPIEILKQWESTQKQDEITTDIKEDQTLWEFFAG